MQSLLRLQAYKMLTQPCSKSFSFEEFALLRLGVLLERPLNAHLVGARLGLGPRDH